MKKIGKYRGKRVDNGEWVEGYFAETDYPTYRALIITDLSVDTDGSAYISDLLSWEILEVDPETVSKVAERGEEMDEKKEIEELAETLKKAFHKSSEEHSTEIREALKNGAKHYGSRDFKKSMFDYMAEAVIWAGYRKADEVRKEIVRCILADIRGEITTAIFSFKPELKMDLTTILLRLERDYGEGVDE